MTATLKTIAAISSLLILSGCTTAGTPTPEPAPTQSKVHCDLIFPAPGGPSDN